MIKISEKAKEKLLNVLFEEQKPFVRFGLQGGGCSGFQYYFLVEDTKEPDDTIFQLDDTHQLIIDVMSMMYLTDIDIDYKDTMMQEGFVFNNPNAATSCGCGNSFSM